MTRKDEQTEGWESLVEEAAEGSLAPSRELEQALKEAEEAIDARRDRPPEAETPTGEGSGGEVQELEAELAALRERYMRLQADFENYRRRALREREEAHAFGHQNLVKDLLPTVDNLERAIEHARESDAGDLEGLLQGVELVQRELVAALERHGLAVIRAEGEVFDPSLHEAMAQVEDDEKPAGTVVQVFEAGYSLRDRMIRPARVVVSRRSDDAAPDAAAPDAAEPAPEDETQGET